VKGWEGTPATAVTRPPRSGPIIRKRIPDQSSGLKVWPNTVLAEETASRANRLDIANLKTFDLNINGNGSPKQVSVLLADDEVWVRKLLTVIANNPS
jgi:hypothetical protein